MKKGSYPNIFESSEFTYQNLDPNILSTYLKTPFTYFKPSGTPIHKGNFLLVPQHGDGCVYILWHHISSVEQATGHVLSFGAVALHHLVRRLETLCGQLVYRVRVVVALPVVGDRRVSNKGKVDSWKGH